MSATPTHGEADREADSATGSTTAAADASADRARARRLLLLRHGRTAWNAQARFQGQLDIPLDDVGQAQAEQAGDLLARLRPDVLVSSDLDRAARTADALARRTGLPVTRDERLRESRFGAWQGLTVDQVKAQFGDGYARWRDGDDVRAGGDGETRTEVGARMAAALREHACILPAGGLLVAATHGGAATSAVHTLLGVPRPLWPVVSGLGNCHWTLLTERSTGRWVLEEHNAGSLPEDIVGDES